MKKSQKIDLTEAERVIVKEKRFVKVYTAALTIQFTAKYKQAKEEEKQHI